MFCSLLQHCPRRRHSRPRSSAELTLTIPQLGTPVGQYHHLEAGTGPSSYSATMRPCLLKPSWSNKVGCNSTEF